MTKEEREARKEAANKRYNNLDNKLYDMSVLLNEISSSRGSNLAHKNLEVAIEIMRQQIRDDFKRKRSMLDRQDTQDSIEQLQQSLNRVNQKNAQLEKDIEEAKTSSGLFIKFIRDKLGI